jgi:hypothetical protein
VKKLTLTIGTLKAMLDAGLLNDSAEITIAFGDREQERASTTPSTSSRVDKLVEKAKKLTGRRKVNLGRSGLRRVPALLLHSKKENQPTIDVSFTRKWLLYEGFAADSCYEILGKMTADGYLAKVREGTWEVTPKGQEIATKWMS